MTILSRPAAVVTRHIGKILPYKREYFHICKGDGISSTPWRLKAGWRFATSEVRPFTVALVSPKILGDDFILGSATQNWEAWNPETGLHNRFLKIEKLIVSFQIWKNYAKGGDFNAENSAMRYAQIWAKVLSKWKPLFPTRSKMSRRTIQNWTVIENLYHNNIIYLPRGPLGRYVSRRTLCERGLVLMVTYSDLFQFVIMLCAVITLVIHARKK